MEKWNNTSHNLFQISISRSKLAHMKIDSGKAIRKMKSHDLACECDQYLLNPNSSSGQLANLYDNSGTGRCDLSNGLKCIDLPMRHLCDLDNRGFPM